MKKKILALFMILVLTMTAFVGCGKDDDEKEEAMNSSYFKELSKLSDFTTGTSTTTCDYKFKSDSFAQTSEVKDYLDENGDLSLQLTMDTIVESNTKLAMDISGKLGNYYDGKLLSFVIDEKVLYLDATGAFDIAKKILGDNKVTPYEQYGTVFKLDTSQLDMDKIMNAVKSAAGSTESIDAEQIDMVIDILSAVVDVFKNSPEKVTDLGDAFIDAMSKNYENLTGTDGDMYTLTISNDKVDTIIDDTINLLNNDAEGLVNKTLDVFSDAISKAGVSTDTIKSSVPEYISQIAKSLSDSKEDAKKQLSEVKFNVVSKIKVDEGKSAKFSVETGDTEIRNGMVVNYKVNTDIKSEDASIADKIPSDAFDITSLITVALSNLDGLMSGAAQ